MHISPFFAAATVASLSIAAYGAPVSSGLLSDSVVRLIEQRLDQSATDTYVCGDSLLTHTLTKHSWRRPQMDSRDGHGSASRTRIPFLLSLLVISIPSAFRCYPKQGPVSGGDLGEREAERYLAARVRERRRRGRSPSSRNRVARRGRVCRSSDQCNVHVAGETTSRVLARCSPAICRRCHLSPTS
jgi:hypothetical protein